jgi:ubiquitin-activating enzyme E1 C
MPEHCIQYIYLLKWKESFDRPVDKDSIEDVNWIYQRAKERAESFGIQGVNYNLTLGVIKNVIPAIASTNAIIAAASCLEAIKLLSYCSKVLDNNFLYLGLEGLHSMVQQFERNEKCNVCNSRVFEFNVSERVLFREMLEKLSGKFALKQPAVYDGTRLVFVAGAGDLAESVLYKLDKNLR